MSHGSGSDREAYDVVGCDGLGDSSAVDESLQCAEEHEAGVVLNHYEVHGPGDHTDYVEYMKNTYISRVYNEMQEEYPIYPPLTWNCFQSVLDGSARTNNAQEGWHMRFNKKFSKRNTSLSHYIVRMKEEEHFTWQMAIRSYTMKIFT
uniref:Uncharacterized protein n=1 Tax=Ditylenchus dipsaci TaxID=166011 RepID=A0A915EK31_9BILA